MTSYPAPLNQDSNEIVTAAQWDAVNGRWFFYTAETTTPAVAITKLEDTPHASSDAMVPILAVRQDTLAVLAANGDYIPFVVDANGNLWITGTQLEDAVAASGAAGHFMLAVRRDTPTASAAAGDYHEIAVDGSGRVWVSGTQLEDAVAGSGESGHFALAIRRDNPTSDAAAGDYHGLHVGALGHLRVISFVDETDCSNARTSALAASIVAKASAGKFLGMQGYATSNGFIQLHNTTSVPADTAVPVEVWPITAGERFTIDGGRAGIPCSTGITICHSSTGPTKTISGSVMWMGVQYR